MRSKHCSATDVAGISRMASHVPTTTSPVALAFNIYVGREFATRAWPRSDDSRPPRASVRRPVRGSGKETESFKSVAADRCSDTNVAQHPIALAGTRVYLRWCEARLDARCSSPAGPAAAPPNVSALPVERSASAAPRRQRDTPLVACCDACRGLFDRESGCPYRFSNARHRTASHLR
jgi:hypothetical protein